MVVYYDPHYPAIASLFVINGTVLFHCFTSVEFWVHCLTHSFLAIYLHNVDAEDVNLENRLIPKDAWSLTAGFMTFLSVFFTGQCYGRYLEMYSNCQTIDECMKLFIRELITFLYMPSVRRQVNMATKYMLAAVFIFYFALSDGGMEADEWDMLAKKRLLSTKEIEYIRTYAGHKGIILTSWATRAAQHACRTEEVTKLFSPPERAALMNRIDGFAVGTGKAMRRIADLMALPLPYAYFHLLNLLMCLNFMMTNWYLASTFRSWLTIPPFVCYVIVFLGLRQLSASLADPFQPEADDVLAVAFPCVAFLKNAFDNGVNLMESIEPDPITRVVTDPNIRLAIEHTDELDDMLNFNIDDFAEIKIGGGTDHLTGWQIPDLRGRLKNVAFTWKTLDQKTFLEDWLNDGRMRTKSVINTESDRSSAKTPLDALTDLAEQQKQLVALVEPKASAEDVALLKSGMPVAKSKSSKSAAGSKDSWNKKKKEKAEALQGKTAQM